MIFSQYYLTEDPQGCAICCWQSTGSISNSFSLAISAAVIHICFTTSIQPANMSALYLIAVGTVSFSLRRVGLVQLSPSASKSYHGSHFAIGSL